MMQFYEFNCNKDQVDFIKNFKAAHKIIEKTNYTFYNDYLVILNIPIEYKIVFHGKEYVDIEVKYNGKIQKVCIVIKYGDTIQFKTIDEYITDQLAEMF